MTSAGMHRAGPRLPRAVRRGADLRGGSLARWNSQPQLRPIGSRQSQALGEALKQQDVELGSWGHRALKLSRAPGLASLSCDHCFPFHPDPEPCLRHGRAFWGQRGKEETRIPVRGPSLRGVPLRQIILFRDTCLPRAPCKDTCPGAPESSAGVTVCSVSSSVGGGISRALSSPGSVRRRGQESAFTMWAVTQGCRMWDVAQGM